MRVLCPVTPIAIRSGTPLRIKLRTAVQFTWYQVRIWCILAIQAMTVARKAISWAFGANCCFFATAAALL